MKGNQQPKDYIGFKIKRLSANQFLNIIIPVLAVLTVYLSYSFYIKFRSNTIEDFNVQKKPVSSTIQVEVLNGCGVSGVADKLTDFLRKHNFDVVQTGNYISYDVEKSIVIDRTGNMINALRVADSLGISSKNVIQLMNSDYLLDVSLVIGKDFNTLKPYQ